MPKAIDTKVIVALLITEHSVNILMAILYCLMSHLLLLLYVTAILKSKYLGKYDLCSPKSPLFLKG